MAYFGQNYYPYQNYYQPQQYQQPVQSPTLYGKIVDSVDIVRATDVPIGMSGVFPKADASCVYLKSWNVDGTTRIDEYKRVEPVKETLQTLPDITQTLSDIQSAILSLNEKVDALSSSTSPRGMAMKKKVGTDES